MTMGKPPVRTPRAISRGRASSYVACMLHRLRKTLHMGTQMSGSRIPVQYRLFALVTIAASALSACSDGTSPNESTTLPPTGTFQSLLVTADASGGKGGVSVTPTSIPEGYFAASIKVRLVGAKPSTTYYVQRAPEVGRALGNDGVCQRALGLSPWSSADAAAAAFITFMVPNTTTPVTVITSSTGDASLDFDFRAPTIPAGTHFDVMFRLLNDPALPTSVYISGCFTVTVL